MSVRIRYNAPITLTFSLLCVVILVLDQHFQANISANYLVIFGKSWFSWEHREQYYRLVSHIFGHRDWNHLLGNLTYVLLLGPILEERFGSFRLAVMILLTAVATGLININFYDTGLMGASGIVFMMISLISIVNIRRNEIPLTLILMFVLYLTREIIGLFSRDGVSQIAHISGGLMGILLGFAIPPRVSVQTAARSSGRKSQNNRESA